MTADTETAKALGRIEGQLTELRNIVVGEDGEGGLRRDLKHLTSLRDRGVGMLILLGLLVTAFGGVLREWIVHAISPGPGK